ncbi:hypothetical protein OIU76_024793 [Salix suchowensis]|nr:hypothetical protein OIU76_024793 [Salix suchowensis]
MRDRCFVCVLVGFILFVICGGVWAVYPVIFSTSFVFGIFHLTITAVGKNQLENYTFCRYCSKPKSPRTHHCRTCGICVLDMDHHCPFIGNCVGATNHRHFIAFLVSILVSTISLAWRALQDVAIALASSAVLLPTRGLVLVYLFVSSTSLEIGISCSSMAAAMLHI